MFVSKGVNKRKSKNMTSQVIVNVDRKIKDLAMNRAKTQGIPLSTVIRSAVSSYADGRTEFGIVEKFNEKTRHEIEEALDDLKKGKNLSPTFKTVAEMKKWLDDN